MPLGVTQRATLSGGPAIPDSVVSRAPDDDSESDYTTSTGLVINPNSDFGRVGARVSQNTSGMTRARVYDYSQSSYILSIDISGLSSGDTFTLDVSLSANTDYGIELDAEGGSYTTGYANNDGANYPITSDDIDIVGRSSDGSIVTSGNSADPPNINDIGDTGF